MYFYPLCSKSFSLQRMSVIAIIHQITRLSFQLFNTSMKYYMEYSHLIMITATYPYMVDYYCYYYWWQVQGFHLILYGKRG